MKRLIRRKNVKLQLVLAGVVSYLYYQAGNDDMHYAWGLISVIFIVGCVVYCIRSKRRIEPSP